MISDTPPKSTKSPKYSPVILPDSPALKAHHVNITGLPRVARDIAADIYNNIQKWNEQHIKGANVLQKVINLKADSTKIYPNGLEQFMTELFHTVQNMSIYYNALNFLSSQMKALVKLKKDSSPMFISLTAEQLADLTEAISDAYKEEFQAKQYVLENIAHSKNKSEMMFHISSWTHQGHITNNINLKLETLLIETGHRDKN